MNRRYDLSGPEMKSGDYGNLLDIFHKYFKHVVDYTFINGPRER